MLTVAMKDGRRLIYNTANYLQRNPHDWTLRTEERGRWITTLRADTVERIDTVEPCKIIYPKKRKR